MPLHQTPRTGVPGAVRGIDGRINQTEMVLPAPIVEARSRWQNLLAGEPVVEPAYAEAVKAATVALYDASPTKPDTILRTKNGLLVDLAGVERAEVADRRAEVTHDIWKRALAWAAVEYRDTVDDNEADLIAACQQRFAVIAIELYDAVAAVPVGFDGQGLGFAAKEIVQAWTAATAAWSEIEALRAITDAFVDVRPYDHHEYSHKVRFARTTCVEDLHLNPSGGFTFALAVCRAVSGPDELWLATHDEADRLAATLWPPIRDGGLSGGYHAGTVVPA